MYNITTMSMLDNMVLDYRRGMTKHAVAVKYGYRSHVSVINKLREAGVESRTRSEIMTGKQNARKNNLDFSFFSVIDTEAKAYFLGLVTADGYVHKKCNFVCLSSIDEELILLFKKHLMATQKIYKIKIIGKRKQAYSLTVASKKLCEDLSVHGVVPKKSLISMFPNTIPDNFMHHFIRGFFDGDGYVGVDKKGNLRVNFSGTKHFLSGVLLNINNSIGKTKSEIKPHGIIFKIQFGGNRVCRKIFNFMYKDSTVFLKRKKDIFIKNKPRHWGWPKGKSRNKKEFTNA